MALQLASIQSITAGILHGSQGPTVTGEVRKRFGVWSAFVELLNVWLDGRHRKSTMWRANINFGTLNNLELIFSCLSGYQVHEQFGMLQHPIAVTRMKKLT